MNFPTNEELDLIVSSHPESEPWLSNLVEALRAARQNNMKGATIRHKARKQNEYAYVEGALRSLAVFARVAEQFQLGATEQLALANKVSETLKGMHKHRDFADNIIDRAVAASLKAMNAEIEANRVEAV